MKLKGKTISRPKPKVVIIPRPDDEDLVFQVDPSGDQKDFEAMCPTPSPTRVMKPGGLEYFDYDDPVYKSAVEKHNNLLFAWTIINALKATPGLEWESVKYDDPSTWELYREELLSSGMVIKEVNQLVKEIVEANVITDEQVKEARDRFFFFTPEMGKG